MGRRGGVCKTWEEDIYWTRFQFIRFTQFLRSDFDQQLALPKTFCDNIKKALPESVTLKDPGGVLWNIEVTSRDDTLYLTHGWQQFVKEHSLKENDFLVFKYNGESLFEVLIFDESLCEKAACYFVRKCQHAVNTEQGGGCGSPKKDSDNSVEEVKTPSNAVDEGVSPEKSLHLNSIRVPLDIPIETNNGKTTNVGVESASAEQFLSDAITDTEPKTTPSKTTTKRTRRPVYADTSVQSKKRGRPPKTDKSVEEVKTPSNGVDEGVSPEKSLHLNSIRVPLDVPIETTNGKTSNVGIESASAEQFLSDAITDTEPKTTPSKTTGKRMRRPVYADTSVPGKKRGRPPKTDNSVEVNTPNGVDEGVSPEKSLHLNSIQVPLAVPIETTNGKTSNAGVGSASDELFMSDAVTDTEPKTVPSQTTGKRTRRPVYANTSVPSKKRGRPRKTDNSVEEVNTPNGVDEGVSPEKSLHLNSIQVPLTVPIETTNGKTSVEEVKTPSNGVDEGVSPEKSLHPNSIQVPLDVPIETTNGKTSNDGVESASDELFMSDAVTDTEPKTVPSQTTGKRTRRPPKTVYADTSVPSKMRGRPPKTVYADTSVPSKKRGRPPKTTKSHERALNSVSGPELSPKVSPKASPKVGSGSKQLYTSNRRSVTKNEIENTLQLAQATCAEDTLLVTMRPTHVYKRFFVSFPNKWRINHLSSSSQDVILRMGKREWLGKYLYHNIRSNGGITGGWKHFALENNLEEFDVCLFKPAGHMGKTLILEMTIFRVVEDITPLTAVNSPGKKKSIKKTPTGVNSPRKKKSVKKTRTEMNSPGKKRSVKKTPAGAVQTELESFEPLEKKREVNITPTSAVQTELYSIEGA
ncbi:uncharacterized protein LOC131624229 isoform X2 [Vicia villosa]|nr:uncharacterized protein LOC131624229 isoform X2 [Vicia villosa]